jgi:hypothetical protein
LICFWDDQSVFLCTSYFYLVNSFIGRVSESLMLMYLISRMAPMESFSDNTWPEFRLWKLSDVSREFFVEVKTAATPKASEGCQAGISHRFRTQRAMRATLNLLGLSR